MTPHPKAEILRAIADGKTVQMRNALRGSDKWFDKSNPFEHINDDKYEMRVKPATININGFEFPEPVMEPLKLYQEYWTTDFSAADLVVYTNWDGLDYEKRLLERGLIHLSKEAAIAHAEALISFTRGVK